jgi:hypothetical protein
VIDPEGCRISQIINAYRHKKTREPASRKNDAEKAAASVQIHMILNEDGHRHNRKSDCFNDFSRLDTAGTDGNFLFLTIDQGSDLLKIRFKTAFCSVVCMTDIVAV